MSVATFASLTAEEKALWSHGPKSASPNPYFEKKSPMSEFKKYRRLPSYVELRPYIPGEDLDDVSVPIEDDPKEGDMVARNKDNHKDKWLVNAEWYALHYDPEPVEE